ncbi:hypothetical protein [Nannocystis pusilla]|uniref:hypothetical protein n=1 Tax=Nannocystis pusilla TaxID=889268 RepID=UPI003DA61513
MVRRLMWSAAFVAGLAAPLAATWSSPVHASEEACTLLSGGDSWTYGGFTVNVTHNRGVTVTGTPPPIGSLPLVLTSPSGHVLTISQSGTLRKYEGTFTAETNEACQTSCPNTACNDNVSWYECSVSSANAMCTGTTNCTTTTCTTLGGSCAGGICVGALDFSARF